MDKKIDDELMTLIYKRYDELNNLLHSVNWHAGIIRGKEEYLPSSGADNLENALAKYGIGRNIALDQTEYDIRLTAEQAKELVNALEVYHQIINMIRVDKWTEIMKGLPDMKGDES